MTYRSIQISVFLGLILLGCRPDNPQGTNQSTGDKSNAQVDSLERELARLKAVVQDSSSKSKRTDAVSVGQIREEAQASSDDPLETFKRLRNGRNQFIGEEVEWPVVISIVPDIFDWHITARVLGRAGYLIELRSADGNKFKDDDHLPIVYPGDKVLINGKYSGLTRDGEPIIKVSSAVNNGI